MAIKAKASRRFEPLEEKRMLAGDVLVNLVNGSLNIQGDELDNQIAITSGPEPGSYLIRGLEGTTVRLGDGGANETPTTAPETGLVVEGVRRDVRVAMNAGDDTVLIDDANFRGNLTIRTGEGADTVRVGILPDDGPGIDPADPGAELDEKPAEASIERSVRIGRSLQIGTGSGDDTVVVGEAGIGRHLRVATGEGADTVRLGPALRPASDDPLAESGEPVDGPAAVAVRGTVSTHLGAGEDSLVANSVRSRGFRANGGADADSMRLSEIDAAFLSLHGGRGDASDDIVARGLRARVTTIHTGGGDDQVALVDSAFGLLRVGLGSGDDTLALGGVTARAAILSGGPGEGDALRDLGENELRRRHVRGFELPADSEA